MSPGSARTLAWSLRGLLTAGVLVLLARAMGPGAAEPVSLVLNGDDNVERLTRGLLDLPPSFRTIRADSSVPDLLELSLLDAAGRAGSLDVGLPFRMPAVAASGPRTAVAGRALAVTALLPGRGGDSTSVELGQASSPSAPSASPALWDTVVARVPAVGVPRVGVRAVPRTAGWHRWQVRTAAGWAEVGSAEVGTWVLEDRPLRVLVLSGPPDWETRFVVRALEESGAVVEVRHKLTEELDVSSSEAPETLISGSLDAFDVVFLLRGAELSEASRGVVIAFVARQGGGLLLQAPAPGSAALDVLSEVARGTGDVSWARVSASDLRWTLPVEVAGLPPADGQSSSVIFGSTSGGWSAAVDPVSGGSVLVLGSAGRGRIAGLGLAETWRWRMEAGEPKAHRRFWRSLADWLAAGLRAPVGLEAGGSLVPPGSAVSVRAVWVDPRPVNMASLSIVVTAPDGGQFEMSGTERGTFLAAAPGVYHMRLYDPADGSSLAETAVEVKKAPFAPFGWARLSALAGRSPEGRIRTLQESRILAADLVRTGAPSDVLRWLSLLGLSGLALAGWMVSRLQGGR